MYVELDTPHPNGHSETAYGKAVLDVPNKEVQLERSTVQNLSEEHYHVLKTFRLLIADLCQQFNGGHPGYVQEEN